jgi:oligopeptide/dipeptide ABC transporter ATP-binding protein
LTASPRPSSSPAPDAGTRQPQPLLHVEDLRVEFSTYGGIVKAVRGVSFSVDRGRTLAIVGESGCGKSVTVQSIMGLVPTPPGRITDGTALFDGIDLLRQKVVDGEDVRGSRIGMIFQDPMSSLNPTMKVGDQIAETLVVHRGLGQKAAYGRAVELLASTHIPEPEKRAAQYPFAFSGGMLQRAMIAMAIACGPSILIADEPTTALDVTIQAQILDLLEELQRDTGMAIILITHNLGVVARLADTVAVMYAGEIVERGRADDVFHRSAHPYTRGLQGAMPLNDPERKHGLQPIEGTPPDMFAPPAGCAYLARCPHAMRLCETHAPPRFQLDPVHYSSCWLHHADAPRQGAGEIFFGEPE